MKACLLVLGFVVVSLSSANTAPQVKGDGKVRTETRALSGFSRVSLHSAAQLVVNVGKPASVKVTADGNVVPLVSTKVVKGQLVIESKVPYQSRKGVRIEVSTPSLTELQVEGSGDVNVIGATGKQLGLDIPGSAKVVVAGKVDTVALNIEGSADVNLFGLQAGRSLVNIQGSANVRTSAKDQLSVNIEGSGNVIYRGNPKVQKSIEGSGNVAKER